MSIGFLSPFGYYPSSYEEGIPKYSPLKGLVNQIETRNYIGYIPIVGGQFIGVIRWIDGIQKINGHEMRGYAVANLMRGTVEFLGLGIIISLIDILVTLGRLLASRRVVSDIY